PRVLLSRSPTPSWSLPIISLSAVSLTRTSVRTTSDADIRANSRPDDSSDRFKRSGTKLPSSWWRLRRTAPHFHLRRRGRRPMEAPGSAAPNRSGDGAPASPHRRLGSRSYLGRRPSLLHLVGEHLLEA